MSTGPGRREVAHRIFASEFSDATHSFTRGDEERAPKYVVSPSGALMNRVFVVGVLTEVQAVNEETVRARIADPTGVFVVYASQYQPDARAALQDLSPPAFVAVTGKANTFAPDGAERTYTSIRPEAVATVDAGTRDHWIVTTAERTIERVGGVARVLRNGDREDENGIARALREYDPGPAYLSALYIQCLEALEVVTGERERVTTELDLEAEGQPEYALDELVAAGDALAPTSPPDPTTAAPPAAPEDEEPSSRAPPEETVVSDDEREAIENEFGTEFATGDEVDSPAEPAPAEVEPEAEAPPDEADDEDGEALPDRLVELLEELDTGEGVPREELIAAGAERFGLSEEALQEAVREAMMDGRCYEPAEDVLRPI